MARQGDHCSSFTHGVYVLPFWVMRACLLTAQLIAWLNEHLICALFGSLTCLSACSAALLLIVLLLVPVASLVMFGALVPYFPIVKRMRLYRHRKKTCA